MKRFVLFLSVLALVLPLFSFAGCSGGEVPRSKYDISAGAIYYTDVPVTLDSEMASREAVQKAIELRASSM